MEELASSIPRFYQDPSGAIRLSYLKNTTWTSVNVSDHFSSGIVQAKSNSPLAASVILGVQVSLFCLRLDAHLMEISTTSLDTLDQCAVGGLGNGKAVVAADHSQL